VAAGKLGVCSRGVAAEAGSGHSQRGKRNDIMTGKQAWKMASCMKLQGSINDFMQKSSIALVKCIASKKRFV
jgi:hypothetical protein